MVANTPNLTLVQAQSQWQKAAKGKKAYDRDDFYTGSTDGHGHADNVQVRINPTIHNAINDFVLSGVMPIFKSTQDFVRNACHHELAYYTDIVEQLKLGIANPQLTEAMRAAIQIATMEELAERVVRRSKAWKNLAETFKRGMDTLLEDGAFESSWDYLRDYEENADSLGEPYSSKMTKLIEEYRSRVPEEFRE